MSEHTPEFETFCDEQGFDYTSAFPEDQQEVRSAWITWQRFAPAQGADARPVAISDEDIRLTLKAHFITADHRLTNAVRDLLNGKFRAYQSPVNKPAADMSPVGYVTQDDLCRLKNGMGAIVSPTNGVATVPVYVACDVAPRETGK